MLYLPIPGIAGGRDPGCLGNIFGCKADVRTLSGGPPGAEVSLCKPGDGGTGPDIFGEPCFGVPGTGGDTFPRTGIRWRSSDRTFRSWI